MSDHDRLPSVIEAQRTVEQLLEQIGHLLEENNHRQAERVQQLRHEMAVLKGQKAKPSFKPSGMDSQIELDSDAGERDDSAGERLVGALPVSLPRSSASAPQPQAQCPELLMRRCV